MISEDRRSLQEIIEDIREKSSHRREPSPRMMICVLCGTRYSGEGPCPKC